MKTTYILHGGFPPQELPENDTFYAEILKHGNARVNILLVYFAKEDDRVLKNKTEDIAQFEKNKGDRTLSYEVADKTNFLKQIQRADIIYLHGGQSSKIINVFSGFANLKEAFDGKTIVGDSAGANALATYYYGNHDEKMFSSTGIIPIKLFCHYSEKRKIALDEFKRNHPDLETIALSEYQMKILEF